MNEKRIIVKESRLLQLHHVVRNRLNSLLGFVDIVCDNKELNKVDREKYVNLIKTLSAEIYHNLNTYLSIENNSIESDCSIENKQACIKNKKHCIK